MWGSLVSWAPREPQLKLKVPRVPLNIQGSALLFLFQATFPKRDLKLRETGFSGIPPLPQKRTSLRGEPACHCFPHRAHFEIPSFNFTHRFFNMHYLICSAIIVCSFPVTVSALSKRHRDERIKFLLFMKFSFPAPLPRVQGFLVQDLKKVNDKCACSISKDTVLQPSSLTALNSEP